MSDHTYTDHTYTDRIHYGCSGTECQCNTDHWPAMLINTDLTVRMSWDVSCYIANSLGFTLHQDSDPDRGHFYLVPNTEALDLQIQREMSEGKTPTFTSRSGVVLIKRN